MIWLISRVNTLVRSLILKMGRPTTTLRSRLLVGSSTNSSAGSISPNVRIVGRGGEVRINDEGWSEAATSEAKSKMSWDDG